MLQIHRLGYALGAQVTGVDLRKPLETEVIAQIRQALLEHIVLCFPGQRLEREHMRVFCGSFGELDDVSRTNYYDPQNPGVLMRSNKPLIIDGKQALRDGGANHWHSDYSFTQRPNTITFLSNQELPDVGGNTMFANMYTAYETLSPAYQRMIEPLFAIHDYAHGSGFARGSAEQRAKMTSLNPPVVHPLVRVHPETGRKALYIVQRVQRFTGMTEEESQSLIGHLMPHAVSYEFVYRHVWTLHDLLIWDNRSAMHVAVQDYDQSQIRRMLRCSLRGPETGELYTEESDSAPAAPELATAN
jgi:taurine dioxygenase